MREPRFNTHLRMSACRWSGNMSGVSRQVDGVRSSRLVYTPSLDTQYGSISCLASSSLGTGAPCVYIILPAGLDSLDSLDSPHPPCSIRNISAVSFKVRRLRPLFSMTGEY